MEGFAFRSERLPEQCRAQFIGALLVGEKAYIGDEALWYDEGWNGFVDTSVELAASYTTPECARNIPVYRFPSGFVVDLFEHCKLEEKTVEELREKQGRMPDFDDEEDFVDLGDAQDQIPVIGFITSKQERKAFLKHFKDMLVKPVAAHTLVEPPQETKQPKNKKSKRKGRKHSGVEE